MTLVLDKNKIFFGLSASLFIIVAAAAALTGLYGLIAFPFLVLFFYAGWQNRDLIFYLLLLSLPFSFEYHFSSALGTDVPDEFIMVFVAFLFFACWVYSPWQITSKKLRHPLLILWLIVIAWTMITVLFSTHPLISLKFLLAKGWYAGAFLLAPLILFNKKESIVAAALIFSLSMLSVVIIILVRHSASGFRFATINDAVFPFFRNHVNYSAMLVSSIPLFIAFLRLDKRKSFRPFIVVAVIVTLFALFFSYARGAWLALLAGGLAAWLIRKKALLHVYIVTVITAFAAVFWLKANDRYLRYAHDYTTTIFHKNFAEHLVATYKLKDVSTAERFYRWIAGVRMIKDNWLTGYGPNTFYENYKGYTVPAYKTWVSDNKDHSTVHNYFLLTAIEQGLPGLLFLLLLFGAMLYYAQQLYHKLTDDFYKTTAMTVGVIVTMIFVVNFLSDLIETDKIGSLFFLCISLLVAIDPITKKDRESGITHFHSNPSPDIQRIP